MLKVDLHCHSNVSDGVLAPAAVAAYVASDMADVAFGVEAAARQFGLDFVRLLTEDYYFVCRETLLEQETSRNSKS